MANLKRNKVAKLIKKERRQDEKKAKPMTKFAGKHFARKTRANIKAKHNLKSTGW